MADTFRKEYTPVSETRKVIITEIKYKAQELHDLLTLPEVVAEADGRSLSIAKTELETAIMWAVKGLTG